MKILKEGKKLEDIQTLYFVCYHCGCEYSCETSEKSCHKKIDDDEFTHYGTYYVYNCPNCNIQNIGMNYQEYLKKIKKWLKEVLYFMLVPALLYKKKEIEDYFTKHLYDYSMFLYNGYAYSNSLPKIEPAENIYQFAIIDKDDTDNPLKGYFSYRIDLLTDCVYNFGLISFCEDEKKKSRRIGIDVYKELVRLHKIHHRIEWRVIGNNPVIRHYDSFCKRLKGNRVHLHDVVKDNDNNYQDEYVYEILGDKWFTEIDSDEIYERSEPI